jgi:hypothetical protein
VIDLPTVDSVEAELMDALKHEGDQWLWEPVWSLNRKCPDIVTNAKVGLVRHVVLGLESRDQVTLLRGEWPPGRTDPLSQVDHERILVEDPPWADPDGTDLLVVIRLRA